MEENIKVLARMDAEAIRWQQCAICGAQQKQRIIRSAGKPDFALCDACNSAFVLEDGSHMRMMYGRITPTASAELREFALKKWVRYFDIRAKAVQQQNKTLDVLPVELQPDELAVHGKYINNMDAYLALEAEKAALLYDFTKPELRPPTRPLRETGDLPNIDDLFRDR